MFDRMQYIIGFPEKIERWRSKYEIRDFKGESIGIILIQKYKSYGLMPLFEYRFLDNRENCLGILRQRKPGPIILHAPPLDILGPQEELRGRIEFQGDYLNRNTGTMHYGPHTLFDALDQKIAWSDSFAINTMLKWDSRLSNFEQLQKKGLDFKTPEGRTIATLRESRGPPGCQIDLFPPVADVFLVLSLVAHVLI